MKRSSWFGLRLLPFAAIFLLAFVLACGSADAPVAPEQPAAAAPAPTAVKAVAPAPAKPGSPDQPARAAPAPTAMAVKAVEAKPTPLRVVQAARPEIIMAPQEPFGAPKFGGTLIAVTIANPPSVDWACHTTSRGGVSSLVYEKFFGFNAARTEVRPQSVGAWSLSADATDYTFTIRDGLVFHDGTAATAADAVSTTVRWGGSTHSIAKRVWDIVQPTHEVVDTKTWRMKSAQPFGLWPIYQAHNGAWLQPKRINDTPPDECYDPETSMVAAGPYTFVEWVPGDRVVMERFEDYQPRPEPQDGGGGAKIPYFDRIESVVIPDQSTMVAGLRTGQLHHTPNVAGDFKAQLESDPEVTVAVVGPGAAPYFVFNLTSQPFNNKKARQAVLMAADMTKWMTAALGDQETGGWVLRPAIFGNHSPWATDVGTEKYHKPGGIDLPAAQALMGEALAEEGMTFDDEILLLAANDIYHMNDAGSYTKQLLESLGLKVNRPAVDWATIIQWKNKGCDKPVEPGATAPGGGWNMYHTFGGGFDPLTTSPFSKTWSCGWQNPEIDQLSKDWLSAPTLEQQKALIDEIQLLVYDEVRHIMLGQKLDLLAFRNEVAYTPTSGGTPLAGAWFK